MTIAMAAIAVVIVTTVIWLVVHEHRPAPREEAPIECIGGGGPSPDPGLFVGKPFRIVSWNIQYAASRKHHFFYDGGDAVHVPRADVDRTAQGLQDALRGYDPAITLIQEIDRSSDRTHRVDQLPLLSGAAGVGAQCHTSATYHRSPFVPHPLPVPLGRVHMDLGILTAGPLSDAQRVAMPLLAEARLRQMFNLKRALLTAAAPVDGIDKPLLIAVTHLSAFSRGDGTLARQIAVLADWMGSHPPDQPWILAGDLNLLPPGDDPSRLTVESDLYSEGSDAVDTLIPRFRTVTPVAELLSADRRTYLPFGAESPDRKIDYIFYGGPIVVDAARVGTEHKDLSDHLPLIADVRIAPGG